MLNIQKIKYLEKKNKKQLNKPKYSLIKSVYFCEHFQFTEGLLNNVYYGSKLLIIPF